MANRPREGGEGCGPEEGVGRWGWEDTGRQLNANTMLQILEE